jgi:hypothetical protein
LVVFIALHFPLVVAMKNSSGVATLHAWGTLAFGLLVAMRGRRMRTAGYVAAYIAGAEGLWRMTQAGVFWEFGKYATVAVLLAALIRHGQWRRTGLPAAYIGLLIPSSLVTLAVVGPGEGRHHLSFNLSGPLALAVACMYFRQITLGLQDLRKLLVALVTPIVGLASGCLFGILSLEHIEFTTESNFATSGGFGPNQVSSTLGLGMLAAFLILALRAGSAWEKPLFSVVLLFLASMSALTFSRSGLYIGVSSVLVALLFLCRDARTMVTLTIGMATVVGVAWLVLLPRLDAFTGGNLSQRFAEKGFSNRESIAMTDLQIFLEHPVTGVGPGLCKQARMRSFGMGGMAHTEFTRLLAEHGVFGFLALLVLGQIGARNFLRAAGPVPKAVVVSLGTCSALFMMVTAMRLVAPAFAFGLTSAIILTKAREVRPALRQGQGLPLATVSRNGSTQLATA